jgi:integrase
MPTDRLTDTAIRAAIAARKPVKLFDGGGLYLLLHTPKAAPGASKEATAIAAYWRQKFYYGGKERLVSHGVYPRVSLKRARQRRDDLHQLLEDGIDPSAKRRVDKAAKRNAAASTFEAVATEWFGKISKGWAPSHSVKIIGRLNQDLFPWIGSKAIASLSRNDLLGTLERVQNRGAIDSARRIRQNMELIFEYARGRGLLVGENPTPRPDALEMPTKGSYASITDPKGVGALIRAVRTYQGQFVTRIALQLAPLLFVRPGELRAAEWAEIDLEAGEWRIPDSRMKGKVGHFVPLSRQAVALFKELQPLTGSGKFVFPSERGGHRPMSSNTLNAALRGLGFSKEQMTTHGFRHAASTLLNESGKWHADAIERQLAHVPRNAVRAAYNRAEHLPERKKMMQWWADHLDGLAAEKVVPISKAKAARS